MHLLFLDEAGTAGTDEFVLGGVAVSPSRWHQLRSRWGEFASMTGRKPETEIKWSKTTGRSTAASRLAELLIEASATAFAVEMRTQAGRQVAPDLFRSGEDIYANALMFIAERFQRFLVHGLVRRDRHQPPERDAG